MKLKTIYGPPGTGKTRTLIEIAHDEVGVGNRVTFVSYTRAAANEAASRIRANTELIRASTIHSLAFSGLGLSRRSVVDADKIREFSRVSGIPFKVAERGVEEDQEGDDYAAVYSYACNRLISVDEAYDHFGRPGTTGRFHMFVAAYEDFKREYGYMDFDDMLVQASKRRFRQHQVVILDEAQDCSPLQWTVFRKITEGAQRVYIAGDDDQAIFEWSGADPHGMQEFTTEKKGTALVLDQSYRVPRSAHAAAHKYAISNIERRVAKEFRARDAEGLVERYGDVGDIELGSIEGETLVLVRDQFRMAEVQRQLHHERVPYTIMGRKNSPYENKFAQAIRACLRPGGPLLDEKPLLEHLRIIGTDWKTGDIPMHLHDFYESIDLFAPIRLRLSTVHGAKGAEAANVVMDLSMSPRTLGNLDRDRDAEARVLYVGLTRCKETLYLCGENPLVWQS